MGGGVSPLRSRKTGTVELDGLGDAPGTGGGDADPGSPGRGRGVE